MHLATDSRSEWRSNVFLSGMLKSGASSTAVRIRNISPRGALIEGPALPPLTARVRLLRKGLSVGGEIVWNEAGHAGVNFDREIDVDAWIQRGGLERADRTARRPDTVGLDVQASSRPESLAAISAALDQVCERLAACRNRSADSGDELLSLDVIAQSLRRAAGRNSA